MGLGLLASRTDATTSRAFFSALSVVGPLGGVVPFLDPVIKPRSTFVGRVFAAQNDVLNFLSPFPIHQLPISPTTTNKSSLFAYPAARSLFKFYLPIYFELIAPAAMGFEPHLHWSFQNEHVLFPFIVLRSASSFVMACVVVMLICLLERSISFALDKQWSPNAFRLSRMRVAVWRTGLYSCVTFLRLCYMLVAMSFHMGLIFTIVITLSIAQFFVELQNLPKSSPLGRGLTHKASTQPLLSQTIQEYPPHSMKTRPRSRSKPDDIFIHPAESNIARADAVALELGLTGDTERVQGYTYNREEPAWEIGKGKDMAREMLLGPQKKAPHSRDPFYISNSDSDSD